MSQIQNLPLQAINHYNEGLSIVDAAGFEVTSVGGLAILLGYSEKLGISHWADDERASRELSPAEQDALCRLIAAAPELLSALQAFMALDQGFTTVSDRILDELIAEKAPSASMCVAVKAARAAIAKAAGGSA